MQKKEREKENERLSVVFIIIETNNTYRDEVSRAMEEEGAKESFDTRR